MRQRTVRLVLASLFCLGMFGLAGIERLPDDTIAWVLLLAPTVAGVLLWIPRLEPQVLSRAVLWGYLFWAFLGSMVMERTSPDQVLLSIGLCSAAALGVLPRDGLSRPPIRGEFAPVAFRGVIVSILVLALADAMMLGTTFFIQLNEYRQPGAPTMAFLGVGSVLMFAAVVGLFRLRGWAFALNLVTNLGVASLAWVVDDLPWQLALGLTGTAALQLLAAAPLARRIAKPGAGDPSAWVGKVAPFAVGGLAVALVVGRLVRHF